jgi:hypothetical protein
MAEVQIKVEIQDAVGGMQKRAVLAVPTDITREELVGALAEKYPSLSKERLSVMVEWPENKPATGHLVTEGALVVVKPRSSGVRFIGEE